MLWLHLPMLLVVPPALRRTRSVCREDFPCIFYPLINPHCTCCNPCDINCPHTHSVLMHAFSSVTHVVGSATSSHIGVLRARRGQSQISNFETTGRTPHLRRASPALLQIGYNIYTCGLSPKSSSVTRIVGSVTSSQRGVACPAGPVSLDALRQRYSK